MAVTVSVAVSRRTSHGIFARFSVVESESALGAVAAGVVFLGGISLNIFLSSLTTYVIDSILDVAQAQISKGITFERRVVNNPSRVRSVARTKLPCK